MEIIRETFNKICGLLTLKYGKLTLNHPIYNHLIKKEYQ